MPTPQSNVEMYLSVIAGHSTEVPSEPTSRVEWFLNEIAKNGGIGGKLKPRLISALPATGESGILYLVPIQGTSGQNTHNEYFWVEEESKYELLGQAKIEFDLSEYAKKTEIPTVPTYTLVQDANDGHKLTFADSDGTSVTLTIPDNNTTYDAATVAPLMDGTADAGTSEQYARADHVHPTDVSRASASDVTAQGNRVANLESENALLRELLQGVDTPIYRAASGNPATFDDGAAADLKSLSVEIVPAQSGSGDPSPDNVRPISGATSVAVTRTGRNLLPVIINADSATVNGVAFTVTRDADGNMTEITANGTASGGNAEFPIVRGIDAVPTLKAGRYVITGLPALSGEAASNVRYNVYGRNRDNATILDFRTSDQSYTFTLNEDMVSYYVAIRIYDGFTASNLSFHPMIRPASDPDATFEPYRGQSVAVSLVDSNSDPLTVYGGTLNVTTGELTVTHGAFTIDGVNLKVSGGYNSGTGPNYMPVVRTNAFGAAATGETPLCDKLTPAYTPGIKGYTISRAIKIDQFTVFVVRVGDIYGADGSHGYRSTTEVIDATNDWFAENPTRVVYELAAPVTYRLSPARLATLSGYNAVSTDAKSVAVEYRSNLGGAKALTLTDIAAASPVGEQHRMVFGGRNLGASVTPAQIAAVRDGSFSGLLAGDYWIINGVTWRIVDMDYWYGCGDTAFNSHHLVIMPDSNLTTAAMNETNATTGGYTGSKMRTVTLPTVRTTCAAAFPNLILTHRDYLVSAVTNGRPSAAVWTDSDVELPSEIMMYGSRILSPANDGATVATLHTVNKQQLALFNLAPRFIKAPAAFWLRDPASATHFAAVSNLGNAHGNGASANYSVRPVFAIG